MGAIYQMPLPPVPPSAVEAAMDEFDELLRGAPEWADWESNRNYEHAIVRDGHRYPVKQIVSMATGTPKTEFAGGPEANSYVQKLGYSVEPVRGTAIVRQAWVFAGLPAVNDFSKLPANEPFTWTASAHRDRIHAGDRAYIYRYGSEAAIVAVASVLEAPRARANLPSSDPALLDASRIPEVTDRVALKLDSLLQNPITKAELVQAGLKDLAVLKAQGGSTFRVDPVEEVVLERLIDERSSKISLRSTLEGVLAGYPSARRSDPFSGAHPLFKTAVTAKQLIDSSPIVAEWPSLITRVSFGRGNWASIPWLAIMDERETTTTRHGIYCVFLFREDGSGVYLTLNQGVTEPRERLGGPEARASLQLVASDIRSKIGGLAEAGFSLDDQVDLRTTSTLGQDYERSTIAHKLYLRGEIPPDSQLFEDLRAVVAAYESVLERRHPQPSLLELSDAYRAFAEAVTNAGLSFGASHDVFLRAFVASLITKPLVILTGLSGSGKTQLALKFGEWLGEEYSMVVPVRPDWNGPEALFGYVDALKAASPDGRPSWFVPDTLDFILTAARNPDRPYLLVLDEMNLAHVERYFADFLSGVESRREVLPNLIRDKGEWRVDPDDSGKLKIPRNLFVVGTVNVDETTYMFSPKVLDRANTIEFRVLTLDLPEVPRVPATLAPGPSGAVGALLQAALDDLFQEKEPPAGAAQFAEQFRALHGVLSRYGAEFGYRSFYEATRFAAVLSALGDPSWERALDLQVMQKVLPRLHGGRRKLEPVLVAIGLFCFNLATEERASFDPVAPGTDSPKLPISFAKVQRMTTNLRANQFVSFSE
jgi:5-methylcytosine-specific restriction enzyme B